MGMGMGAYGTGMGYVMGGGGYGPYPGASKGGKGRPQAGVDGSWKCKHCANVNWSSRENCNRCKASRQEAEAPLENSVTAPVQQEAPKTQEDAGGQKRAHEESGAAGSATAATAEPAEEAATAKKQKKEEKEEPTVSSLLGTNDPSPEDAAE